MTNQTETAVATNETLIFSGCLNETDIRNIWFYVNLVRCRPWLLWTFGTIIVVILLLGIIAAVMVPKLRTTPFILTFLSFVVALCIPYANYCFTIRRYRKRRSEVLETRVTLTQSRVAIENDEMRSEFGWKVIRVVADTPEGFLFCGPGLVVLFWLPLRVLNGEPGRCLLRALLQHTGVRVLSF